MAAKAFSRVITALFTTILVSACATAPAGKPESDTAGLNDDSYDVLFATEFPVESEADALARAELAWKEGEIDKALFFYVRALQFRPDNVDLLAHIGDVQKRRGNLTMAHRAYLLARKHDPAHAVSLEGLGLIYMAWGRDDVAKSELKAAVESLPTLWRAHNALGVYADKSGDYAEAQMHYDTALGINPDAADVLNNRGYSRYLAGDFEGAVSDLHEAASKHGFRQAWANLGMVYAEHGYYENAISTYRHVMSEAHAFNNVGKIAMANGEISQAAGFLSEAVRRSPTYFPDAEQNLMLLDRVTAASAP